MQILRMRSVQQPIRLSAHQIRTALTPSHWKELLGGMVQQTAPLLPAATARPDGPEAKLVRVRTDSPLARAGGQISFSCWHSSWSQRLQHVEVSTSAHLLLAECLWTALYAWRTP